MDKKIPITFIQRKPRAVGNYSLEFIFEDIRNRLHSKIDAKIVYSKYESNGIWKRIYNIWQAKKSQNKITHITGDVNYLGALLRKSTTIHTILDCVFLNTNNKLKYNFFKFFWLKLPIKRSKFVTAISTSTKNEIIKHYGSDPGNIIVIPVAISTLFQFKHKAFNVQKPTILQLGTAANKNIVNLIESLNGISCTLIIVGAKHDYIYEALEKNKIDYNFLSGLTNEEILMQYEQADILTLISTYEGFGMPILEAQAVGRVVITANLFSMPEVGGDAAHYVDPLSIEDMHEGFEKIINNEEYRNNLIKKGFENIKRFDPQFIANQYLELYKKTIHQ